MSKKVASMDRVVDPVLASVAGTRPAWLIRALENGSARFTVPVPGGMVAPHCAISPSYRDLKQPDGYPTSRIPRQGGTESAPLSMSDGFAVPVMLATTVVVRVVRDLSEIYHREHNKDESLKKRGEDA
jgi:hypothetical protein